MPKISTERKNHLSPFFTDLWQLMKDYGEPSDDDQYWTDICNIADTLNTRYRVDGKNDQMVLALVRGFINGLDNMYKERRKDDVH